VFSASSPCFIVGCNTPHLPRYCPMFASDLFIAAVSGVYLGLVSVQAVGDVHLCVSYSLSDGDAASLKCTSAWMMLPRTV